MYFTGKVRNTYGCRVWVCVTIVVLVIGISIGGVKVYLESVVAGRYTGMYAYALTLFIHNHGRVPQTLSELEMDSRKRGDWQLPLEGHERPYYKVRPPDSSGPKAVLVQPSGRWYHLSKDVFRVLEDGKTLEYERFWFADPKDLLEKDR